MRSFLRSTEGPATQDFLIAIANHLQSLIAARMTTASSQKTKDNFSTAAVSFSGWLEPFVTIQLVNEELYLFRRGATGAG
jgi:hypothetical protein